LRQARELKAKWESGDYETLAALARAEGIGSGRVSELLALLQLAPEILAAIDVPVEQLPAGVTKEGIRRIVRLRDAQQQRRSFRALCAGRQAADGREDRAGA
jgi:hypothetical protein